MKKLFFILAAAAGILVSCTKNEVAPAEPQEITYMTSPITKAPGAFSESNEFLSWAYYTGDADWDYPATATSWIDGAQIGLVGGVWKDDTKSYYWPKDNGKLTFFAFSDNSADPALAGGATVDCASETGVVINNYDITQNIGTDLLVADAAENKQANETTYGKEGVPTLFKHKLSKIAFKIQYQLPDDGVTDFTLKSITFTGIDSKGSYTQYVSPSVSDRWLNTAQADQVYTTESADFTTGLYDLETSATQTLFLPQEFDGSEKVVVVYNAKGTGVGKDHTLTGNLQSIFTKWEVGKRYICTITITPDEILWDPAVEEWEDAIGFTATL